MLNVLVQNGTSRGLQSSFGSYNSARGGLNHHPHHDVDFDEILLDKGISEMVYYIKGDGLKFRCIVDTRYFPFDVVQLPIQIKFTEPFG